MHNVGFAGEFPTEHALLAERCPWRKESRMGSAMLGRHVYRVVPRDRGRWCVEKEGEKVERGQWPTREEAMRQACDFAARDLPSKVVLEAAGGVLVVERLFGEDTALELERALGAETKPPPMGEKAGR